MSPPLRLRLNFSGRGRRSALGLIGRCSPLASLPPPPLLSVSDSEESPLALAIHGQCLATKLPFARRNLVVCGELGFARKSSDPDNGFLQMMVTPRPDVSQPSGLIAWGQKNPDPVTINPHAYPRLLPLPAPCLESFDLWLSFNTIAMVPGRNGQFSLPSGQDDQIRGVNWLWETGLGSDKS